MAKLGEGDPRWIVEERADAVNVNNWHWTEKNASGWSKDKFNELFVGLKVESDKGCCEITEIESCEGEASANNRKAKLFFFYEWELKLLWRGHLTDCETHLKGAIEIPNLSDENEPDEVDIKVTVKKETDESRTLKEIMIKDGSKLIREAIAKYIRDLKEVFSQGMVLPANTNVKPHIPAVKPRIVQAYETTDKNGVSKDMTDLKLGVKLSTSKITDEQEFKCTAEDLYDVLTNKEKVCAYMGGGVVMEANEGGRFALLDGNITGTYTQLVQNKKIVQRWRSKAWPAEHYSVVTIELEEKSDCTILKFTQTGVPTNDLERTKQGWIRNYWERIKMTFGFGAKLF